MGGTKLFFAACVLISLAFAGVLLADLASTARNIPPEVAAGRDLWQENGCAGCHTLYGQGALYAPDLTHIVSQRGQDFLREFLVDPPAFHPGERVMPRFGLTRTETDHVLAFLGWVGDQDAAERWSPRAVVVRGTGGLAAGVSIAEGQTTRQEDTAVTRGRATFTQRCASCHALTQESGGLPGPSLYGIADRAWYRVVGQGPHEYIRNSILHPSDYVVEGYADVMQKNFGDVLTSSGVDDLVAFLMTLEEDGGQDS